MFLSDGKRRQAVKAVLLGAFLCYLTMNMATLGNRVTNLEILAVIKTKPAHTCVATGVY